MLRRLNGLLMVGEVRNVREVISKKIDGVEKPLEEPYQEVMVERVSEDGRPFGAELRIKGLGVKAPEKGKKYTFLIDVRSWGMVGRRNGDAMSGLIADVQDYSPVLVQFSAVKDDKKAGVKAA